MPAQPRFVFLTENAVVFQVDIVAHSLSPLETLELMLPLPNLPTKIGTYALEALWNGEILGSHRLTVNRLEDVLEAQHE